MTPKSRAALTWAALTAALVLPLVAAALSPLLAWRSPIYILASFAGILALGLMLVQPLLALGLLPGVPGRLSRRGHLWLGAGLGGTVAVHVGALWLTSPPDVVDALLLRSPTPFSLWGVLAMWALFAVALGAALRRRLRPKTWRRLHMGLVLVIVPGSVVHVLLIDGTMGTVTKGLLCVLVLAAAAHALAVRRAWALLRR